MTVCFSNNYSGVDFWRGWHASYNRWLLRYIYIPLGGSKRRLVNSFLIFTFVAIWHDIELKLLAWGWLIVLFIVPEVVMTSLFCTDKMRQRFGSWHLHICAFGGTLSIWLMITANLVGFAVGVDGILEMWAQLFHLRGNDSLKRKVYSSSYLSLVLCFALLTFNSGTRQRKRKLSAQVRNKSLIKCDDNVF